MINDSNYLCGGGCQMENEYIAELLATIDAQKCTIDNLDEQVAHLQAQLDYEK